jgi:hypothetical protein
MDIRDDDWELAWACFNCPPRQGEAFDAWIIRAKAEYQETFTSGCHPDRKSHCGYGLKPSTL